MLAELGVRGHHRYCAACRTMVPDARPPAWREDELPTRDPRAVPFVLITLVASALAFLASRGNPPQPAMPAPAHVTVTHQPASPEIPPMPDHVRRPDDAEPTTMQNIIHGTTRMDRARRRTQIIQGPGPDEEFGE